MPLPSDTPRVLVVEDDLDIAAALGACMEQQGLSVDYAYSLRQARQRLSLARWDVMVLDLQLPDGDGVGFLRVLRDQGALKCPVIILTARGGLQDKLQGFEAGALEYLVKPVAGAELVARIRAIARQVPPRGGFGRAVGPFRLDLPGRTLEGPGASVPLSETGATLLRLLLEAHPGSVTTEALCQALWGDAPPESIPLRSHVHLLRRQLEAAFGHPLIHTLRGVGYRFEVPR